MCHHRDLVSRIQKSRSKSAQDLSGFYIICGDSDILDILFRIGIHENNMDPFLLRLPEKPIGYP